MSLHIDLAVKDGATTALGAMAATLTRRRPLNAALGKRGEIELRAYFQKRDAIPNARGWKSLHFWGRIRKATAFASADEQGATILISDPAMNQKVHGGTITPKEGKFLAVPARQEAYGKSPRVFNDLHFVPLPGGRGMLAQNEQTVLERFNRGKNKGQIKGRKETGGGVFYWLVKSVTQDADPLALPPPQSFVLALREEARAFLGRRKAEG